MLLKKGSRGEEVRVLQNELVQLSYTIDVDGIFGSQTKIAVIDFQKSHDLNPDGIVGSTTDAAISAALGREHAPVMPTGGESNLKIVREIMTDESTIGSLFLNGSFFCYTLELPWKNNQSNISCIPLGVYAVHERRASESTVAPYPHLHVLGVPGRSYILVHRGNTAADILGCILVGETRAKNRVNSSTIALDRLMDAISGTTISLAIENVS